MKPFLENAVIAIANHLNNIGVEQLTVDAIESKRGNMFIINCKRSSPVKKLPQVSIMIPTLGRRSTLFRLLEIVANYEYEGDLELLIIVGTRGRLTSVLNIGLIRAKYDIVHRIDDDILPSRDSLKKLVSTLLRNSHLNVVAVNGNLEESPRAPLWICKDNRIFIIRSQELSHVVGGFHIALKKPLISVGGYREILGWGWEDLEIGLRLVRRSFKILINTDTWVRHITVDNMNLVNIRMYHLYRALPLLIYFTFAEGSLIKLLKMLSTYLLDQVRSVGKQIDPIKNFENVRSEFIRHRRRISALLAILGMLIGLLTTISLRLKQ